MRYVFIIFLEFFGSFSRRSSRLDDIVSAFVKFLVGFHRGFPEILQPGDRHLDSSGNEIGKRPLCHGKAVGELAHVLGGIYGFIAELVRFFSAIVKLFGVLVDFLLGVIDCGFLIFDSDPEIISL